MDALTFQNLNPEQVAQLVRQTGPKVCVFPINGTRRWFMLEHAPLLDAADDFVRAYLDLAGQRHVELYRLLFDHGLDTLLTPIFGPELLTRGDEYLPMAVEGLAQLVTSPVFQDFYRDYRVRVRFYGDYRRFFASTPYAYLSDLFDQATAQTLAHDRFRLFFGVCANDPTETVAEWTVRYHAERGCLPDRQALITHYYGEYVPAVDLFIGFDRFCVFDMPLLATGEEDLYFTVSPSPYLTGRQLRAILYDHLYARRGDEPDYGSLAAEDWAVMREFYRCNHEQTLGVGARQAGFWYPVARVTWPEGLRPGPGAEEALTCLGGC
jgi:tuberculosinol/isotuberculosinol synthase